MARFDLVDGRYIRDLKIETIMELIPHRHPFLLLDRILEIDIEEKTCTAIKNVSMGEMIFEGHFPGHPILPGVMSIEAMAQAAAVYIMSTDETIEDKLVYFMTIDSARFRRPITPGDQFKMTVTLNRKRGPVCRFSGVGHVDGELAVECEFSAMIVDK